jgi:hypothetical protein
MSQLFSKERYTMQPGGRFSIKLACKNPACTYKVFDLPDRLMPDGWFEDYNDAVRFIQALQAGPLPNPLSADNQTRISRALNTVAARFGRLDFRNDVVWCDCGYSCHLTESSFLVMRVT